MSNRKVPDGEWRLICYVHNFRSTFHADCPYCAQEQRAKVYEEQRIKRLENDKPQS